MSTDLRTILDRVASGEITPQEGQALLDQEAAERGHQRVAVPSADARTAVARLAVRGTGARLTVIADPTVDTAVAEGPHRVSQEGDLLLIRSGVEGEGYETTGTPATFKDWVSAGWRGATGQRGGTPLRVRVNPHLPLDLTVVAGSLHLAGVQAPVRVVVEAGSAKLADGRGALDLTVTTGSADVAWQFTGESSVGVELGSAAVRVLPGSDVVVTTDGAMAKLAVTTPDGVLGSDRVGRLGPVTVGAGAGRLAVTARLGAAEVTVA